jgi:hypothetical protein
VDALVEVVALVAVVEDALVVEWGAEHDPAAAWEVAAWEAGISVEECLRVQPVAWEAPPR